MLRGGRDNDEVRGDEGNDTLLGESGNDTINGDTGDDVLTGGQENDTFIYHSGGGHDTITDFNFGNSGGLSDGSENNDFIDLSYSYDSLAEIYGDQLDDGILNQSNDTVEGVDYSDNSSFDGGSLTFTGQHPMPIASRRTILGSFASQKAPLFVRLPARTPY